MNALSLYHDLKERGVILEAQGECLKVDAPVGAVTEEDKTALVKFKPILLKLLSRTPEEQPLRESKARWSEPGLIRILDPFTNEWHEWPAVKCLASLPKPTEEEKEADGSKRKRLAGRPERPKQHRRRSEHEGG